jgi:D-arabinose 1-dehydrogenase-like Zn-dependent alcohol dehydrogenase
VYVGVVSSYVRLCVPHNRRYVVPLPSGLDLETACLLPCSGLTAYSAIKKTKTGPNDFLVIIGARRFIFIYFIPICSPTAQGWVAWG